MSIKDLANAKSPLELLIGNLDERDFKIVSFPGANGLPTERQLALWALTKGEEEAARKRAYSYVREVMKFSELDIAYDEQQCINDSKAIEILSVAMRDPNERINPFCRDATQLRDRLKSSQIRYLWKEYLTWLDETDVIKDVDDFEKEISDLTESVGKGYPIAPRLSYFDTPALRRLLHTAVGRLSSAATGRPSGSSSPSDSAG